MQRLKSNKKAGEHYYDHESIALWLTQCRPRPLDVGPRVVPCSIDEMNSRNPLDNLEGYLQKHNELSEQRGDRKFTLTEEYKQNVWRTISDDKVRGVYIKSKDNQPHKAATTSPDSNDELSNAAPIRKVNEKRTGKRWKTNFIEKNRKNIKEIAKPRAPPQQPKLQRVRRLPAAPVPSLVNVAIPRKPKRVPIRLPDNVFFVKREDGGVRSQKMPVRSVGIEKRAESSLEVGRRYLHELETQGRVHAKEQLKWNKLENDVLPVEEPRKRTKQNFENMVDDHAAQETPHKEISSLLNNNEVWLASCGMKMVPLKDSIVASEDGYGERMPVKAEMLSSEGKKATGTVSKIAMLPQTGDLLTRGKPENKKKLAPVPKKPVKKLIPRAQKRKAATVNDQPVSTAKRPKTSPAKARPLNNRRQLQRADAGAEKCRNGATLKRVVKKKPRLALPKKAPKVAKGPKPNLAQPKSKNVLPNKEIPKKRLDFGWPPMNSKHTEGNLKFSKTEKPIAPKNNIKNNKRKVIRVINPRKQEQLPDKKLRNVHEGNPAKPLNAQAIKKILKKIFVKTKIQQDSMEATQKIDRNAANAKPAAKVKQMKRTNNNKGI